MTAKRDIVIDVRGLVKRFGGFVANDKLTFSVYRGEVFGFLGANGAGKTTAMRILCGLSGPSEGSVMVAGYDVRHKPEQVKKSIGYMSQKFSLYEDLTVRENIRFYGGIYGLRAALIRERTTAMLSRLGLEEHADKLIGSLPLGWRQKLAFSVAILHEPEIVFLDEPTGGVDPITRRQFWEMIHETARSGITVFVTTHYMDEAEYCDRVCIMSEGRIVALDSPQNLKNNNEASSMQEVFIRLARNT